jgi:hypothetical protein
MTLGRYLLGMLFSTITCWAAWVVVLIYIDPQKAGLVGFLAFYISLFFALVGTLASVGFYLRRWFSKNEVVFAHITPSFRQGVLLSLCFVGCLIMQSFKILTWWDGILFVGAVALLEFYFMSK